MGDYLSTWMLTKYWYSPVDGFDVVAFRCGYGPVTLLCRLYLCVTDRVEILPVGLYRLLRAVLTFEDNCVAFTPQSTTSGYV